MQQTNKAMKRIEWFNIIFKHGVIDKRTSFYLGNLPDKEVEYNTPSNALRSFEWSTHYEKYDYWAAIHNDVVRWWNKNKDKFKNGQLKIEL